MRHACGWGNQRYYYGGVWMEWKWLHKEFEQQRTGADGKKIDEAECILACKYQVDYHCTKEIPCVHAFYIRRASSGVYTLDRQIPVSLTVS